jgi:hypothetical protein
LTKNKKGYKIEVLKASFLYGSNPHARPPSLQQLGGLVFKNMLYYKQIKTQYVFLLEPDGTLKIKPVTDIPKQIKFKSVAEAKKYIKNYKEQL